jgi:hypothetical protein
MVIVVGPGLTANLRNTLHAEFALLCPLPRLALRRLAVTLRVHLNSGLGRCSRSMDVADALLDERRGLTGWATTAGRAFSQFSM